MGIALVRGNECTLVTAGGFDGETARQVSKEPVRAGEGACVGGVRGGVKATRCEGGDGRRTEGPALIGYIRAASARLRTWGAMVRAASRESKRATYIHTYISYRRFQPP